MRPISNYLSETAYHNTDTKPAEVLKIYGDESWAEELFLAVEENVRKEANLEGLDLLDGEVAHLICTEIDKCYNWLREDMTT